MWNFLVSLDEAYVVEGSDVGRETAVDAEHLSVDERGHREEIEDAATVAPGVGVAVLGLALVIETVDLGDLTGLVVAAQQRDPIRPFGLQRQQAGECFEAVVAPVDEVAEEHVVRVGYGATSAEQLLQIIELIDNTTN